MITEPTVLILGAGASMPYWFPSGTELFHNICEHLTGDHRRIELLDALGLGGGIRVKFRDALYKSGKKSVDEFLEHAPEFLEIGKVAIAAELIPLEIEDRLFHKDIESKNWYKYLFGHLNTKFEQFGANKLSIITYNYDRSLEHFLFTSLKYSYPGKTERECAEQLIKIPIVHLHGKLGDLPWQTTGGREYVSLTPSPDKAKIFKEISNSIKIIYEDISNDKEFNEADKVIKNAKYIYFLGFGYNKTNLERINIKSWIGKSVIGSTYGLTPLQRNEIIRVWHNGVFGFELCTNGYDIIDFLKNRIVFR